MGRTILHPDVFVLLTSSPAHSRYLDCAVESHMKLGAPMGVGWDYYKFTYPIELPSNVRVFCSQGRFGVQEGEAWQIEAGLSYALFSGFKYFFKSAGDIVVCRPEGLNDMIAMLNEGDHDLISQFDREVDTKVFFGKVLPLYRIATCARAKAKMNVIEVQYMEQVLAMGLSMRHQRLDVMLDYREQHVGHDPKDWWNHMGLLDEQWKIT